MNYLLFIVIFFVSFNIYFFFYLNLYLFFNFIPGFFLAFGSQFSLWQGILSLSFGEVILMFSYVIIMIFLVIFSISEITSILPFTGGSYSFIRVSLGPFWGFMGGLIEYYQCTIFAIITAETISNNTMEAFEVENPFIEVLIWVLLFLIGVFILNTKWNIKLSLSLLFGFLSFALWMITFFGMTCTLKPAIDIHDVKFIHSSSNILGHIVDPFWFFIPLSVVPIYCSRIKNPKKSVPKLLISSCAIFSIVSILTLLMIYIYFPDFVPGHFVATALPLIDVFRLRFYKDSEFHMFNFITYAPSLFILYSFMLIHANNATALASSGFIPSIFGPKENGDPKLITYILNVIVYILFLCIQYDNKEFLDRSFLLLSFGTYFIYSVQMAACYVFYFKFSSLKREYKSPLGIYSSFGGTLLCFIAAILCLAFNDESVFVLIAFSTLFAIGVIVYTFYSRHTQKFSEMEQKTLFAAYVINANQMKNNKKRKTKNLSKFEKFLAKATDKIMTCLAFLSNPFQDNIEFDSNMEVDTSLMDKKSTNSQSKSYNDESETGNDTSSVISSNKNNSRPKNKMKNSPKSKNGQTPQNLTSKFLNIILFKRTDAQINPENDSGKDSIISNNSKLSSKLVSIVEDSDCSDGENEGTKNLFISETTTGNIVDIEANIGNNEITNDKFSAKNNFSTKDNIPSSKEKNNQLSLNTATYSETNGNNSNHSSIRNNNNSSSLKEKNIENNDKFIDEPKNYYLTTNSVSNSNLIQLQALNKSNSKGKNTSTSSLELRDYSNDDPV